VAIAAQWVVNNAAVATTDTALYTVPTAAFAATAGTYLYPRDLVVTNSGATTIFVAQTTAGSPVSTTTGSFQVPSGGTVILSQCQVPAGSVIKALSPGTAGTASVGYGTNVSYV
jgi:hypothetical protein